MPHTKVGKAQEKQPTGRGRTNGVPMALLLKAQELWAVRTEANGAQQPRTVLALPVLLSLLWRLMSGHAGTMVIHSDIWWSVETIGNPLKRSSLSVLIRPMLQDPRLHWTLNRGQRP